jgi:arylsulfatase A-like enzyme
MFSSDNGPEVESVVHMRKDYDHDGARPWRGVKRDQWEGGHRVPFIARWPEKIPAGTVSDQPLCLTDVMATCAAIVDVKLPRDSAEDSFNLLPALRGNDGGQTIRPFLLHQSSTLALAIRQGPWKYLDHRGSGGNDYRRASISQYAQEDSAPTAPGQLYHLINDPGETTNLYFERPDVVKALKALLEQTKVSGRSRED